jgi:hypothetical protein
MQQPEAVAAIEDLKAKDKFWQTVCLYDDFTARLKKLYPTQVVKDHHQDMVNVESLAKKLSMEVDNLKRMFGARRFL